ncbi:4a-hydroxytetrahydrobiopterin dehydratase [Streptomyces roseirectus]|uniref:Putative pterin-4-alpha-carbinolamine dehydratase n=1 Tax=Streptomyces roseirectus TaxID=2768066 RepID=A0A7H0I8X9_9ACTN|nr:4a-hydroxytetrahydrobiopterin dehydratase [Streptomyces roseirectus]QNP69245.1 4a-hydroxytetrahydrobiopterin dehydratase [Streptomyces roseirectus]
MSAEPLSQKEIEERLAELPGWSVESGNLSRSYRFSSHADAAAFVGHVARIQDELNHHSELTLGYDTVRLAVSTHSAGGALTGLDFELARRVEGVAAGQGAV